MNWMFQGKNFLDIPEDMYGFIYQITYTNGQKYIGQKQFYSQITLAALQSGIPRENSIRVMKRRQLTKVQLDERTPAQVRTNVRSGLVPFDVVAKPMKWQKYEGSSKSTVGLEVALKEILYLVPTKRNMTYMECKALFACNVLESDEYLNDNVLGKFFRDNLV